MSPAALPAVTYEPKGADATREKLLQATHELLLERAGAEPSVSQVCERAGVQVGMVSYCFGGKRQMLEALVYRIRDGVAAELDRLVRLELEPEERLRRNLRAMIQNFVRFPYGSQLAERLRAGEALGEQVTSLFAGTLVPFYAGLLTEGARGGELREVDPRLFFVSVVGMCEYLFAARSLFASGDALDDALIDRFTDHTIDLILDGVRKRRGEGSSA